METPSLDDCRPRGDLAFTASAADVEIVHGKSRRRNGATDIWQVMNFPLLPMPDVS